MGAEREMKAPGPRKDGGGMRRREKKRGGAPGGGETSPWGKRGRHRPGHG